MDKVDMPAGRELDALVAEKVMGIKHIGQYELVFAHLSDDKSFKINRWSPLFDWPEWDKGWTILSRSGRFAQACYNNGDIVEIPHYSSDIGAAWEVLRKLETKGLRACIWPFPKVVNLYREDTGDIASEAHGETVPLAICRAALKVMEDG